MAKRRRLRRIALWNASRGAKTEETNVEVKASPQKESKRPRPEPTRRINTKPAKKQSSAEKVVKTTETVEKEAVVETTETVEKEAVVETTETVEIVEDLVTPAVEDTKPRSGWFS